MHKRRNVKWKIEITRDLIEYNEPDWKKRQNINIEKLPKNIPCCCRIREKNVSMIWENIRFVGKVSNFKRK